jgi:predicted TPR repeat methyltransferase
VTQPSADDLLREAAARHRAGEVEAAAHLYRCVLALRPGDGNALNLLGVIARGRGDVAEAVALSARAVATMPDSPVFLAAHGAALAEAGRLEEAVAALRRALARRPDDATALRNLGQALTALGEARAALAPLRRAAALAPGRGEPWLALAHALRETGSREAADAARRAASSPGATPRLVEEARFLLAALGEDPPPDRAPADYVRDLFDGYAPRFDADLEDRLGYRTPAALAALLREAGVAEDASRRVLDLGCGTGLSGAALRPFARHLTGLDLSPRMLEFSRARGVYDALEVADLLDFLPRHPRAFGLVAAADVLNYLGDLGPALRGIAGALEPGGLAAFSLESGAGAPYALGPGLRYRHDPAHAAALAARAGLREVARRDATLREERSQPVAGVLFVLAT